MWKHCIQRISRYVKSYTFVCYMGTCKGTFARLCSAHRRLCVPRFCQWLATYAHVSGFMFLHCQVVKLPMMLSHLHCMQARTWCTKPQLRFRFNCNLLPYMVRLLCSSWLTKHRMWRGGWNERRVWCEDPWMACCLCRLNAQSRIPDQHAGNQIHKCRALVAQYLRE